MFLDKKDCLRVLVSGQEGSYSQAQPGQQSCARGNVCKLGLQFREFGPEGAEMASSTP